MPPTAPARAATRVERLGRAAFVLVPAAIALRLAFAADLARQNVYLKVFAAAALAFAAGEPIYTLEGGFRYPPLVAAALVPFAWCGPLLGSILWRLCMCLCLWRALAGMFAREFPWRFSSRERGAFLLLLAPAVAVNVNLGQPNVLILAWSLTATTGVLGARAFGPALALAAAAVTKVYPLAYGLVLAVLRPRLFACLALLLASAGLLPFVLQDPGYVAAQYRALVELLRAEDRTGDLANAYRDLRLLCAAAGAPMPAALWLPLQALGGAAIAALAFRSQRRGVAAVRLFASAFSLTACWYMLLGPATEKATYVLLAPTLAWSLLAAWRAPGRAGRWYWGAVNLLFLLDHVLPAPGRDVQAAQPWTRCALPLTALLATAAVALGAWREVRRVGLEPAAAPE